MSEDVKTVIRLLEFHLYGYELQLKYSEENFEASNGRDLSDLSDIIKCQAVYDFIEFFIDQLKGGYENE